MKKLLTILFFVTALTSTAQNIWRAPSQFNLWANFSGQISQNSGTDSLYILTTGSNSTISHGYGAALFNPKKGVIGNFNATGYRVAGTASNIQLQQGSTDSITITFSGDTAHLNATVTAWDFNPPLPGGGGSGWSLTGNSGTNPTTNYIGTSDYTSLKIKRNANTIIELSSDNKGEHVYITDSVGNKLFESTSDGENFNATVGSDSTFLNADNGAGNSTINGSNIIFEESTHGAAKIFTRVDSIYNDASDTVTYIGTDTYRYKEVHALRLFGAITLLDADSATIYALTPANGTQYYCNDCTGNGITGRIVAFIGSAWRRLRFD